MAIIITPNMNLPVPVVGQEPGPQYAQDINSCMSIIDGHNHTSGYGVPITPSAINWNSDLTSMNNRLLLAKSVTFTVQGSPLNGVLPDIGALYVSGVDLYYNDISGNHIQITQGGGVAGSPGSISNLTPPASASYSSIGSKFIWQSASNTSAGMDNGPVTIRQEIANAHGITIQSPVSLAADYSLTLPGALPGQQNVLTVDNSGNVSDVTWNQVADNRTRSTGTTVGVGGVAISNSCGMFTVPLTTFTQVTNMSVTLTTSGRPVMLMVVADGTGQGYYQIQFGVSNPNDTSLSLEFQENGTAVADVDFEMTESNNSAIKIIPSSSFSHVYSPSGGAGTYTYTLFARSLGTTSPLSIVANSRLIAYEL